MTYTYLRDILESSKGGENVKKKKGRKMTCKEIWELVIETVIAIAALITALKS